MNQVEYPYSMPTWNLTPDNDVSKQIAAAFAGVGHASRDHADLSYERPSTLAPARRSSAS